ncbi:MAG: SO_0444 family Cu/Zn efflux transporter [Pirellulales bacterium]|nr:SO_0444 family Cu/Zn efflux transporter [Pirellulales bacterium]
MIETAVEIAWQSWSLLGQMSPYLLLGFLVAGVLSVYISPRFVERHLGGRGFWAVTKASLLGIPLPLCSCSVIPVSASLRRHGAGRAATTSFLISTPQTGVDSIAVTYAMLGVVFAVYRPVVALITGLVGGVLVMLFARRDLDANQAEEEKPECQECCCSGHGEESKLFSALKYGLVTLPRDVGLPLLIGIVVAGVIAAIFPADQWKEHLGGGIVGIVLAMAIGVPIYVCDTASVPIAVGLIHLGASPGAALAFLIAGPATNVATITAMWKYIGGRAIVIYLLTIAASAILGGLTLDWLFATLDMEVPLPTGHEHHAGGGWISSAWAMALLAVMAYSYFAKKQRDAWIKP